MFKTFAVISHNTIINVIVADTKEIAETVSGRTCVEYTDEKPAGIGWTYDGINFNPPVYETPID